MQKVLIAVSVLAACLVACTAPRPEPSAADVQRAESLRPREAQLAERYERSCMACHAVSASGAPLTGFAPHWGRRLDKGMEQLVKHALEGFNAMPPKGLCSDCTADDLRALTRFMSSGEAA